MPESSRLPDPGRPSGRGVRLRVTHLHPRPDVAVVAPVGEMDSVGAPAVADRVRELVGCCECLVLDMRRVTFLDAGGIHALLDGARAARAVTTRLLVVGLDPAFHRVLRICGVESELTLTGVADGERAAGVPLPAPDDDLPDTDPPETDLPETKRPDTDRPVAGA
ncbi:anti-anti-sigma factor [Pseudonocardia sediminis]|uniref:Anti-anti-sigma factor n=1 Tax=Pseudonocardia sediminis TaxID=1397368 RepID=A0A4Q7V1C4_PSEST|nr:STAS domain-containing protein [Pseudonocardia sediminis]RZT87254.1 anti-anti-sigma factor [Pseudonocardia sediminis]